MYQKICALKRKGAGKTEIASRLNLDIKTVNKYYAMAEKAFREYKTTVCFYLLSEFACASKIAE